MYKHKTNTLLNLSIPNKQHTVTTFNNATDNHTTQ